MIQHSKFRRKLLIAGAVTLAVAAMPVTAQQPPIKIGASWPLTGNFAGFAKDMILGFDMAVADINARGGIKGRPIQLLMEDSRSTPEAGVAAFRKLVEVDKVSAVLTIFTGIVTAQIPLGDQLKVPFISSVETPGLSARGQYSFQHSAGFANAMPVLAQHFKAIGVKRVYAFFPDNSLGEVLSPRATSQVKAVGAEYAEGRYKLGAAEYRGLTARAKEFNPEIVMITGQGTADDGNLIKQLRETGVTVPIYMGANLFNLKSWRESVGTYVEGITFAGADIDQSDPFAKDFVTRFKAKNGNEPSYLQAAMYDQVRIMADAADKAGTDGTAMRDHILKLKDFQSAIGGKISMDSEHQTRVPIYLLRARNGQLLTIKPGDK